MSKGLMSIKLIMVPDHGSFLLPKKKKCEKSLVIKGGLKWNPYRWTIHSVCSQEKILPHFKIQKNCKKLQKK